MSEVTMTPVASSNIAAIGHDPESMELHVQFHSGATYVYSGVDAVMAEDMASNPSPGAYFARQIKGHYPFRRI